MADSGKNAAFTFAEAEYNADDCIQDTNITNDAEDITYYCGGHTKHIAGNVDAVFTATLAIDATDEAKLLALTPGVSGSFVFYPAGNVSGNITYTSTNGTVISAPLSAPQNGVITLDITIALDDLTVGKVAP